uniref:Uncharacterized protein n=1 Tax=Micrurus surinamensis TaxID=129470 RepID=A0A2D4PRK7_MICSU
MPTKPEALFSWSTNLEFGFWLRNLIACDKYSIHFCCSLSKFEPSRQTCISLVLAIGNICLFRHGDTDPSTQDQLVALICRLYCMRNDLHWQKACVPWFLP